MMFNLAWRRGGDWMYRHELTLAFSKNFWMELTLERTEYSDADSFPIATKGMCFLLRGKNAGVPTLTCWNTSDIY